MGQEDQSLGQPPKTVKFSVGSEKGNPMLGNIKGLKAGKGVLLDVQKMSVVPYKGGKGALIQAGKGFLHADFGPFPL